LTTRYLIGLLLGTEDDWPTAFTEILSRLGPVPGPDGGQHAFDTERITIEPFGLRDRPRYHLVIDRLAYWYYHPREWLKKVSMMDGVYLLNSPFTFQSMEKHAAYCAMMRLGLKVPETVLVPYKNPPGNDRYAYTAQRYNQPFDLDAIAERIGYPLYMKPYDGGGWRGVSRIRNADDLHRAYDESGEMLMHLQASVEGYDVFARALSIGAETMVMRFDPGAPMHERYRVDYEFLAPETGAEVISISKVINAFFRWEFNSCEVLVKDGEVYPIDYANACPDVAVTWLFIVHEFLAGLFTYVFLRALGMSFIGALVGGLAYMMGGPIASYVSPGHDGKLYVSALFPLMGWTLVRGLRDGHPWAWPTLALITGLGILTPHPQLMQYSLVGAGAIGIPAILLFLLLAGYGQKPRESEINRSAT